MPTLAAAGASVPAAAVAGCVSRLYEPLDDSALRVAESDRSCLTGPLPRRAPLVVTSGADLSVRAAPGYVLGAEVVDGAEAYVVVSASTSFPATIDGLDVSGWGELTRVTDFGLTEISFTAPLKPGDYLVAVAAQIGTNNRTYRELGTVILYPLRVTAA